MSSGMNKGDKMDTLMECTNHAVKEGFTEQFRITGSELRHLTDNPSGFPGDAKNYSPDEIAIKTFYRFEGQSDPADNAILYLIETSNGIKGTLVDGYGPTADPKIGTFIKQVEDIQKEKLKNL